MPRRAFQAVFEVKAAIPAGDPPVFVQFYDVTDPEKTPVSGPGPGLVWTDIKCQCDLDTSAADSGLPGRRAFVYAPMNSSVFKSATIDAPIGDGPVLATSKTVGSGVANTNGTGNPSSKGTGPSDQAGNHVVLPADASITVDDWVLMTFDPGSPWQVGDRATAAMTVWEGPDGSD